MEVQNIQAFMKKWKLTGRLVKVTTDYSKQDGDVVTRRKGQFRLTLDGASLDTAISWGADRKEPAIPGVISYLRSLALAVDDSKDWFDTWARNLGYSTDSRQAEYMYGDHCREAASLEKFLGTGRYRELLWETKGL